MSKGAKYDKSLSHATKFQDNYCHNDDRHQHGRVSIAERDAINNGNMTEFDKQYLIKHLKSEDNAHLEKNYLQEIHEHIKAQEHLHKIRGFENKTKDCNEA